MDCARAGQPVVLLRASGRVSLTEPIGGATVALYESVIRLFKVRHSYRLIEAGFVQPQVY